MRSAFALRTVYTKYITPVTYMCIDLSYSTHNDFDESYICGIYPFLDSDTGHFIATRADRLVRLEFAKNQYHRFSIALLIHLFLFKVRVTGIIRKGIN